MKTTLDKLKKVAGWGIVAVVLWTISVPLQWGVVSASILGAQSIAAGWIAIWSGLILLSDEPAE